MDPSQVTEESPYVTLICELPKYNLVLLNRYAGDGNWKTIDSLLF